MNIHRLHRRVSRALARVSGLEHRRTPRERAPENVASDASHWTIPVASRAPIDSLDYTDWRRHVLAARGKQLHVTCMERNDRCAIAILDAKGIVTAWHDRLPHAPSYDPGVLSRHMSQFYLPDEIALQIPFRHLSIAAEHGVDTQRGWRRRPGGEIFWGVTVIHSILLSDGELLGYSHLTRLVRGPAVHLSKPLRPALPRIKSFALMA